MIGEIWLGCIDRDQLAQFRRRVGQRRFRDESAVAAIRRRVCILGVVLRQLGEIGALFELRLQVLNLGLGFGVAVGFAVSQVAHRRVGIGRDQDLRQVHLRFSQVEASFVGVVKIRHVGVGDVDVRRDLLVDQLVHRKPLANLARRSPIAMCRSASWRSNPSLV
jgi:hypothetical protein